MSKAKSIIITIMEGESDKSALGILFSEFFNTDDVCFVLARGDITSKNIITEIQKIIEEEKKKYNFQWRDVIRIIHIVDTDGAFTHNYVENKDLNDFLYYEDHIEAKSILAIEARNKQKSELMLKLYSTGKIRNIPYRVYYNSRNLEHVLHDILINLSDEEKQQLADDFSLKYEGHLQDFIEFVSSNRIAVSGSYKETWKFIQEGLNSLHRYSNMHQIFQTEQEVVPKDTQGQNP